MRQNIVMPRPARLDQRGTRRRACLALAGLCATAGAGMAAATPAHAAQSEVVGSSIAQLALDNVGDMACSANSLGGQGYGSSCTGNAGQPEYWCADFAMWVWRNSGVDDLTGLTAAARSFYAYGQANGTLSGTPAVGDAVVFSNAQGDTTSDSGGIHHVAIVTAVGSGTVSTVSGDWGGSGGSEAGFAGSSHVVNNGSYPSAIGTYSNVMGMWIEGYIAPPGLTGFVPQPGDFDDAGIDDLSGDGHADLVFRDGGSVQYLPNDSASNPGGVPFTGNSTQVAAVGGSDLVAFASVAGSQYADLFDYSPSTGWVYYLPNGAATNPGGVPYVGNAVAVADLGAGIKKIMAADVTGDGHADLLYEKSDDTVWYLPNNIDSTPDHLPFTDEVGVEIASLPSSSVSVTAGDVTGDGYADLLYVDGGNLFFLPNNILSHSDHLPFTGEVGAEIAGGFGSLQQMTAADVSGDKYADLLWTDGSGSVYYAPNMVDSDAGHTYFPTTGTRVAGIPTTAELG